MLSKIDHDAMERAIDMVRQRDAASCAQIDAKLRTDNFQSVGRFAAYSAQCDSLHLAPWQFPPVWIIHGIDTALSADDERGIRSAARLSQRMRAAGLSRFEPDPVAACEAAERASPA